MCCVTGAEFEEVDIPADLVEKAKEYREALVEVRRVLSHTHSLALSHTRNTNSRALSLSLSLSFSFTLSVSLSPTLVHSPYCARAVSFTLSVSLSLSISRSFSLLRARALSLSLRALCLSRSHACSLSHTTARAPAGDPPRPYEPRALPTHCPTRVHSHSPPPAGFSRPVVGVRGISGVRWAVAGRSVSLSLSLTHTHSLSLSHTHTYTHSPPLR